MSNGWVRPKQRLNNTENIKIVFEMQVWVEQLIISCHCFHNIQYFHIMQSCYFTEYTVIHFSNSFSAIFLK